MLIYVLKMSSRKAQKTSLFAFRPEASTLNEKAKVQVYIHMDGWDNLCTFKSKSIKFTSFQKVYSCLEKSIFLTDEL